MAFHTQQNKNGVDIFSNVRIRDGHDNFFTPVRLLFALMVLVGHAFGIVERTLLAEPNLFFDYKPSYLAVNLFFIASGFLVTKSMLYREDLVEYGAARSLRILPALAVHVLFVMFAIGPFVTNLPLNEFFANPQFWSQPFQVLSFYQTDMVMPGTFATNADTCGSGALWTLRYEVLAYLGTAILFALGLLKHKWLLIMQFVVFALVWPIANLPGIFNDQIPSSLLSVLRFGLAYGLGAAIYALQDKLSFHVVGIVILGIVASLLQGTVLAEVFVTLWLGYIVFWMAYVDIPKLNGLKKLSDTSYGIYIYHWVILQTAIYFMPSLNVWQLMAIALPITTILAYASWHLVEKPILKKKVSLSKAIKSKLFGNQQETVPPTE